MRRCGIQFSEWLFYGGREGEGKDADATVRWKKEPMVSPISFFEETP
jgi:hypothetical protein